MTQIPATLKFESSFPCVAVHLSPEASADAVSQSDEAMLKLAQSDEAMLKLLRARGLSADEINAILAKKVK